MPRYRKKPVVIEAIRTREWARGREDLPWFAEAMESGAIQFSAAYDGLIVKTLEGDMLADISAGDWIIRGVKGELYPCKADIFELTYEPAPADGRWIVTSCINGETAPASIRGPWPSESSAQQAIVDAGLDVDDFNITPETP